MQKQQLLCKQERTQQSYSLNNCESGQNKISDIKQMRLQMKSKIRQNPFSFNQNLGLFCDTQPDSQISQNEQNEKSIELVQEDTDKEQVNLEDFNNLVFYQKEMDKQLEISVLEYKQQQDQTQKRIKKPSRFQACASRDKVKTKNEIPNRASK